MHLHCEEQSWASQKLHTGTVRRVSARHGEAAAATDTNGLPTA